MTQFVLRDHPTTRSDKGSRNNWGSIKTQRTMSMTLDAWDIMSRMSDNYKMNRSEILEILIRHADQVVDLRKEREKLLKEMLED